MATTSRPRTVTMLADEFEQMEKLLRFASYKLKITMEENEMLKATQETMETLLGEEEREALIIHLRQWQDRRRRRANDRKKRMRERLKAVDNPVDNLAGAVEK